MPVIAFAGLRWREAPMPDASGPVELATLPPAPDGAFRAFVRFPPGWRRTVPGHYAAAEEVLVLEGALSLNEVALAAGDYAWVPERTPRSELRSAQGALAFAWFSSAPRWIAGASSGERATFVHRARGRLRESPPHETWIVDPPAATPHAAGQREVLELGTLTWRLNQPIDSERGRFFLRLLS